MTSPIERGEKYNPYPDDVNPVPTAFLWHIRECEMTELFGLREKFRDSPPDRLFLAAVLAEIAGRQMEHHGQQ